MKLYNKLISMDRSSSGTRKPFFKSSSPSNSSSGQISVQPEVLQALNAKVLKIQQSCQNLVKICIPNINQSKHTPKNSPTKLEILNISPADFNKVTTRITDKPKKMSSPLITPRADYASGKIDLKIENRSPVILQKAKSNESQLKANKKSKSLYPVAASFNTDLNKSNIEKLKVKKFFKISKAFLKNIMKLCNTCPESGKISSLIVESCENFKKSLENIEKEEKFVSFCDEHVEINSNYAKIGKSNSGFDGSTQMDLIERLRIKNDELECEIMKTKHMILMFCEERSVRENDLIVHIVKRVNKFSNHLNSAVKKTKGYLELVMKNPSRSKGEGKAEENMKSLYDKINSLESNLSQSKLKIFELELSNKRLNSYKSEHFSLVSEFAKTSENLENLKKSLKLKELENKQKDLLLQKLEENNTSLSNSLSLVKSELESAQNKISKSKHTQDSPDLQQEVLSLKQKITELESQIEKTKKTETDLKSQLSEMKKKSIQDLESLNDLKSLQSEKVKLEDTLKDFYKVLKEKITLEGKLETYEETLKEKISLESQIQDLKQELIDLSSKTKENEKILLFIQNLSKKFPILPSSSIEAFEASLEETLTSLKSTRIENSALQDSLSKKTQKISKLKSKFQNLNSEVLTRPSLDSIEPPDPLTPSKLDSLKSEFSLLKSENEKLLNMNQSLTNKVQSINSKLSQLDSAQATMSNMIETLKSVNDALAEENRLHVLSKSLLISKHEELEGDVKSITERLFKKSHEISELEDKLFSLSGGDKTAFSVNFDELNRTKLALDDTRERLENTVKDLGLANIKITFMAEQINQIKSQNEVLRERNGKLEKFVREKSVEKGRQSKTMVLKHDVDDRELLHSRNRAMTASVERKSILKKGSKDEVENLVSPTVNFLQMDEQYYFNEDSQPPILYSKSSESLDFQSKLK